MMDMNFGPGGKRLMKEIQYFQLSNNNGTTGTGNSIVLLDDNSHTPNSISKERDDKDEYDSQKNLTVESSSTTSSTTSTIGNNNNNNQRRVGGTTNNSSSSNIGINNKDNKLGSGGGRQSRTRI